jgi:hypothetical protein
VRENLRRTRPARRIALLILAVTLPLVVMASGDTALGAGGSPSAATPITALPYNETQPVVYEPAQPVTGAANRNLAAACAGGDPLYQVHWYKYTPTAATSLRVSGIFTQALGRNYLGQASGVAVLTANQQVMECKTLAQTGYFEDGVQPPPATTQPVGVAAGATVYVVQFLKAYYADPDCVAGDYCYDGERRLSVTTVSPPAKPDLVVTGVSAAPTATQAGNPVTFRATIKNQGTAATPSGVIHDVAFSVDGSATTLSNTFAGALRPGESVTLTANGGPGGVSTWTATAGTHNVVANVDSANRITGETSETNNTRAFSLVVGNGAGLSDLVVSAVSWTPTSPVKGSKIRFTAIVTNIGSTATPAGKVIGVSFRPNGIGSSAAPYTDVWDQPIPPGGSVALTATAGGTSGTYVPTASGQVPIHVIVDDVNRFFETNDSNNTLVTLLTVG